MPIKDVNSPVNTCNTGSKLRSSLPLSPGARNDPRRVGGPKFDSAPSEPQRRTATHQEVPVPSSTPVVTGPED